MSTYEQLKMQDGVAFNYYESKTDTELLEEFQVRFGKTISEGITPFTSLIVPDVRKKSIHYYSVYYKDVTLKEAFQWLFLHDTGKPYLRSDVMVHSNKKTKIINISAGSFSDKTFIFFPEEPQQDVLFCIAEFPTRFGNPVENQQEWTSYFHSE